MVAWSLDFVATHQMCMKVSRASKHFGTFRGSKKMLSFQENTNTKDEDTKDTHACDANKYCGLTWLSV